MNKQTFLFLFHFSFTRNNHRIGERNTMVAKLSRRLEEETAANKEGRGLSRTRGRKIKERNSLSSNTEDPHPIDASFEPKKASENP